MWRRIHSNRDPRDTLLSEIQKEFSSYIHIAAKASIALLSRNPRLYYWLMVSLLVVSIFLSFIVFRHPGDIKQQPVSVKTTVAPVNQGFEEILQATAKIKETLRLKHLVDSISSRKSLTATDSIALDSALSQLQRLNTNH
jgi:hypothetical protein